MKKRVFLGIAALIVALCFIGCEEAKENQGPAFTLTVTGIPQGTTITAATLVSTTEQDNTPLAVAMYTSGGTFKFYEPQTGIPMPDPDKPFRKSGSYSLLLVEIDLQQLQQQPQQQPQPTKMYMYMNGQTTGQIQVSKDISIKWADFVDVTQMLGG